MDELEDEGPDDSGSADQAECEDELCDEGVGTAGSKRKRSGSSSKVRERCGSSSQGVVRCTPRMREPRGLRRGVCGDPATSWFIGVVRAA